jgi:hypothetical protein
VVGAGDGVVVDGDRARAEGEHAGAEAVRLGAGDAHAGDGVVGHGGVGAGPGAGAADLDAVLGLHARTRTDDLVAVDIGGQGRAEDEDAGLLEQVDQRVLHRDRVFAGAGLTVGDDRVIALVSGRCLTGELVHLGHVHVVNEDVGVQRVDAAELSAAIGDGALVVAVDRQPLDGDVGAVLDADDRVLVGQAPAGVHQVDRQVGRVGGEDGGQPLSRAGQRDVLAVDGELFLEGPGRNEDRIAVVRRVDRGLDRHARGHVEAVAEMQHLDAGQRIGAVGPGDRARYRARRAGEAGQVVGGMGAGEDRRVGAGAAADDVIAGAAGDDVVAAAGEDRIGARAGVDNDVDARGADDELTVMEARGHHRAGAEVIRIEVDRIHADAEIGEGVAVNIDVA